MKAVFGMLKLRSGTVTLDGEDITALMPQERVLKGMGFAADTECFSRSYRSGKSEMGAFIRSDDICRRWNKFLIFFLFWQKKENSQQASYLAASASRLR